MKPHISWTQLNMFERCGEQYRRTYVLGERIPPSVALCVGSATHVPIEKDLKNKLSHGRLLEDDEVKALARDSLVSMVEARGLSLSPEEKKEGRKKIIAKAIDTTVSLASLHHKQLAPRISPISVEREWRVTLDGYPYDIIGRFDIQESDTIIDTKTSNRRPGTDDIAKDNQLTLYAIAGWTIDRKLYKLRKDFLVKTSVPQVFQAYGSRDLKDFDPLLRRLEVFFLALEKGFFPPTSLSNPLCSPRFCGFAPTCKYYRRTA